MSVPSALTQAAPNNQDRTVETVRMAYQLGLQSKPESKAVNIAGHELVVTTLNNGTIQVTEFDKYLDGPIRPETSQVFVDGPSFVAYWNMFEAPCSILRGSLKNRTVTATFDYHSVDPGDGSLPDEGEPKQIVKARWQKHNATLQSVRTPEWEAFWSVDGKEMTQIQFADFLDDWGHVVTDIDAAKLSEIALNLQGSETHAYQATVNRSNGTFVFTHRADANDAQEQTRVPQSIAVQMAPFEHSDKIEAHVFVRYRIDGGKPKFKLVIRNAERIEQDALRSVFDRIEQDTGRKVLIQP